MLWRLLGHFSYDKQAGIALTTALSILSLILLIYTGLDLARYHMINRGLSSAAQQTVEWMANRGASATEDPNVLTRDAIVGRMGKNIIPSTALYSGITSVTTTFSYDGPTGVSRLIVKANYNLMLRKTFNLQPLAMSADARIKLNPVFVSIVFSSGEMRSEGNDIYGQGLTGSLAPNRGVSWSSPYYTGVINQTVGTRSTPTHNYYMTAALVKELASKFQYRKHYMNIIPVSATINLNPKDYVAIPQGTNEGQLPLWIYNSSYSGGDDTSAAIKTEAYCITNRTIAGGTPSWGFLLDYYNVIPSEISTTLPFHATNTLSHDQLLADNTISYTIEGSFASYSNPNWNQPRGYPYSKLIGDVCPAYNTTPALASFQELTTGSYTPDSRSKLSPSQNEIFWDYMRNYIDPDLANNYAIWGSPNISFGLQIAFENIGYVQNYKKINSKLNDYDKNSEFFVYVVSDQIGGVKNAGGAAYITNPTDNNRYPFANLCQNAASAIQECAAIPIFKTYSNILPTRNTGDPISNRFQFTHFWWDNAYNVTGSGCFTVAIGLFLSCERFYSAHPEQVVHNFYNIINYSIDLKYDKNKDFKRPKVFFIDTGSGKTDDECQASNKNQSTYTIYDTTGTITTPITNPAPHYTATKPCMAYAEMAGYNTNYPYIFIGAASINATTEGALINTGKSFSYRDEWIDVGSFALGIKTHASGFDKVFAYKFNQTPSGFARNLDAWATNNLPIDYYNSNYKLQVRSNSKSSAAYDNSVNNATNAANIAKYVVQQSLLAPPILRPY